MLQEIGRGGRSVWKVAYQTWAETGMSPGTSFSTSLRASESCREAEARRERERGRDGEGREGRREGDRKSVV